MEEYLLEKVVLGTGSDRNEKLAGRKEMNRMNRYTVVDMKVRKRT